MNNLSQEEKQRYIKLILLAASIVLLVYLVFFVNIQGVTRNTNQPENNGNVFFKQLTLHFFSYHQTLNSYPDRITIHFPYLLVIHPDSWKTDVYNILSKRQEKIINEVLLDYYNGVYLYNKQGYETYLNNTDLGLLCDRAFLISFSKMLCITRPDENSSKNILVEIDIRTRKGKQLYSSPNTLTAVSYWNGNTYIGEYNFDTNKAFLTIHSKRIPAPDLINTIYPTGNQIYLASFKSQMNQQTESYAVYDPMKNKVFQKERGTIVFF